MVKRGRGRPSTPEDEKQKLRSFKFPPDLWELIQANIPDGERTRIVQEALRQEALRRQGAK